MTTRITVHASLDDETEPVGTLWPHTGTNPTASFRYADTWLQNPKAYPLEPALPLTTDAHHTRPDQLLFASIADSAPDRWGQVLIQRAHATTRANTTLMPHNYLLAVSDHTRIGALRYSLDNGQYLAEGTTVPPLASLPDLLAAAHQIDAQEDTPTQLELILAPGSSLGGARPKANILDTDGTLSIAKFNRPTDTYPLIRWEAATLAMAHDAGITVPNHRLHRAGGHDILLLARFDRDQWIRKPFISALTLLDAPTAEAGSYADLAHAIRQHGANVTSDLHQLWMRLVFTVLVTNTDNHLRNHAFTRNPNNTGWDLAPAYDINPTPRTIKPRILTLPARHGEPAATLQGALDVADIFGIPANTARQLIRNISRVALRWRTYAGRVGLTAADMAFMETAFEHSELHAAANL